MLHHRRPALDILRDKFGIVVAAAARPVHAQVGKTRPHLGEGNNFLHLGFDALAKINPRMRGGCDGGLGVKRHAEARFLQHCEIVGAVADRHRLLSRQAVRVAQFNEGGELRLAPEDRLGNEAR